MRVTADARKLEVHEHWYVSGPNANIVGLRVVHSHEGGDQRHQHEQTGPAAYTIDKDEWASKTGLKGGGRKKFTARPSGEQLPLRELEEWQKSFDIVVVGPLPEAPCGPGVALPERLRQGFGLAVGKASTVNARAEASK